MSNFPEATFIQGATSIPDSRVGCAKYDKIDRLSHDLEHQKVVLCSCLSSVDFILLLNRQQDDNKNYRFMRLLAGVRSLKIGPKFVFSSENLV